MRVAPVGLLFRDDAGLLWKQARLSALPTHVHPLGIEGAQLLALAVALCTEAQPFDRPAFFARLREACTSPEFRGQIERAAAVRAPEELAELGNRIEALYSVPTAIASFALTPDDFAASIAHVIFLGGDTDTTAAMAGALTGAYLGSAGIPRRLVDLLENSPKGGRYIAGLADQLFLLRQKLAEKTGQCHESGHN
jgi:poly(ADP-ribose) glycohydrolase ARH3